MILSQAFRLVALLPMAFAVTGMAQLFEPPAPARDPRVEPFASTDSANPDAAATLVVFNESDRESKELARFYAEKRGIPFEQVLGLRCSTNEEISREEFDNRIAQPLIKAFISNFWWKLREPGSPGAAIESNKIRYVAVMRGMPLKISQAANYPGDRVTGPEPIGSRNEASVDSELAVLSPRPRPISGYLNNPYFRSFSRIEDARQPELMLVCRLDGPTPAVVRRMITDSLAAEQQGLRGFAYVDARGIREENGFKEGDDWLLGAASDARKHGVPVILDNTPGMFPDTYPMRHAAFYFGWYAEHVSGPFAVPGFRFQPGAVACHIHSFSATSLRDPQHNWCAPLLSAGAAATMGNVYEPYLGLTPHLDVFFERLRSGFTFAESAYMAQRGLSWMTTFVGDPLYRPFPPMAASAKADPNDEWEAYRKGAEKWFENRADGEAMLRESARKLKSGLVWEGLGLLELDAERNDAALEAFEQARTLYGAGEDAMRPAIYMVVLYKKLLRPVDALMLAKKQIAANPKSTAVAILRALEPSAAPAAPAEPAPAPAAAKAAAKPR